MASILQRLKRLESILAGPTTISEVVSIVIDRHSQAEIDAFLQTEGIIMSDRVMLIVNSIITPPGQEPGSQLPIRRLH